MCCEGAMCCVAVVVAVHRTVAVHEFHMEIPPARAEVAPAQHAVAHLRAPRARLSEDAPCGGTRRGRPRGRVGRERAGASFRLPRSRVQVRAGFVVLCVLGAHREALEVEFAAAHHLARERRHVDAGV